MLRLFKICLLAAVITVSLALTVTAHQEQDSTWVQQTIAQQYRVCDNWDGSCRIETRYRQIYKRVYRPTVRHYAQPRLTYDRDDRRDERRYSQEDRAQCLNATVDVLSTEHTSQDNAENAAEKLWMAKTQWDWGSKYMDLQNAADVRWRCSASNAHDTVAGKLSEGISKLQGKDGQNVRCSLFARPCRAVIERDRRRGK